MTFFFYLTVTLFVVVCLFMILLVLIQKGRGGGLASAFGGSGGNTAFGAKTGDVLTWATSIVFGVFIVLAVALNLLANHRNAQITAMKKAATQQSQFPAFPDMPAPAEGLPAESPLAPPTTLPSTQP